MSNLHTNLAEPMLKDFMNQVEAMIPSFWRTVGIQLHVPNHVLDAVQAEVAGLPDSNVCVYLNQH